MSETMKPKVPDGVRLDGTAPTGTEWTYQPAYLVTDADKRTWVVVPNGGLMTHRTVPTTLPTSTSVVSALAAFGTSDGATTAGAPTGAQIAALLGGAVDPGGYTVMPLQAPLHGGAV